MAYHASENRAIEINVFLVHFVFYKVTQTWDLFSDDEVGTSSLKGYISLEGKKLQKSALWKYF